MGEGDPLPQGRELTEGPVRRRGSLTRAQTIGQREIGVKGLAGARGETVERRKTVERTE